MDAETESCTFGPAFVIRAPEHFPGGAVHRVRVLEGGAKRSRRPGSYRGANILLPIQNARRGGEVRLRLEAGPVAEHVAQRHLGIRPRIRHVEPRQEAARMVVQREQMLVLSDADGHGGERLGAGADRENGVRGHRKRAIEIPDASYDDELKPVLPHHGEAGDVCCSLCRASRISVIRARHRVGSQAPHRQEP